MRVYGIILQAIGGGSMSDLVTLTNASKLVSKNPSTLRRLINEGKISSIKSKDGHHQIYRSDLIAYFATTSDQRSQQVTHPSDQGSLVLRSLNDQIDLLKSMVDRSQRENESLRDQN